MVMCNSAYDLTTQVTATKMIFIKNLGSKHGGSVIYLIIIYCYGEKLKHILSYLKKLSLHPNSDQ